MTKTKYTKLGILRSGGGMNVAEYIRAARAAGQTCFRHRRIPGTFVVVVTS